jgi:hypothetical protein
MVDVINYVKVRDNLVERQDFKRQEPRIKSQEIGAKKGFCILFFGSVEMSVVRLPTSHLGLKTPAPCQELAGY